MTQAQFDRKVESIINKYYRIDIDTKTREQHYVFARMIYYKVLKDFNPKRTISSIGRSFRVNKKNHATVIHAFNEFDSVCKSYPSFVEDYKKISILCENLTGTTITQYPTFKLHPVLKYETKSIREVFVKRGQAARERYEIHRSPISSRFCSSHS